MFELDPRLAADTTVLGDFALSRVLLMNDSRYPWVILVPRQANLAEIYQLSKTDQQQLLKESSFVAEAMANNFSADKMNVAALGNVVKQLHIHHVARFNADESWPAPVWGRGQAVPYAADALEQQITSLRSLFAEWFV
jgi:diadenosine tetraphosphate (Ap4A) HIT family hydrolase